MALVNIAEADVTRTDYGLALDRVLSAVLLYRLRGRSDPARIRFSVFFFALATATLTGGTVHGFLYHEDTPAHRVVWNSILIAIGVVALSAWMIASRFGLFRRADSILRWTGTALFVGYCVVVLLVRNTFAVAIIHYLPAVFFLLLAFADSRTCSPD